jgi:hypothetical protein
MFELKELAGRRVLLCAQDGPAIATARDGADLIGEAFGAGADVVAVPAARLAPEFFRLSSKLAGEITQKFVNYRIIFAVIGDISAHIAQSQALRDYVLEARQGKAVCFVNDLAALEAALR